MERVSRLLIVAPVCVLAASGCQGLWQGRTSETSGSFGAFGSFEPPKLGNPFKWGADDDGPRKGEPERVVATWIDTIRHTPGEKAERGFGGRLYFYDRKEDPIAVDGQLVIYAFDEADRLPTDHKPNRRYVFPAEQLASHMSESDIGASYSFWLPWGDVGGPSTDVSLIARFQPTKGGGLVVSDQATQRLPGLDLNPDGQGATMIASTPNPNAGQGVRLTGFAPDQKPAKSAPDSRTEATERRRLSTTTIRLR